MSAIRLNKKGSPNQNRMKVTVLDVANRRVNLTQPPEAVGSELVETDGPAVTTDAWPTPDLPLTAGAL